MIMFTICQVVQLPTQSDILLKEWKTLGMLIPGKSHSWVDSRNSRVSIETLDFARVHTFPTAGGGTKGVRGGDRRPAPDTIPGQCRDPIAAYGRST